ncbi:hypothetical protein F7P69_06150 [Cellulosimicrobium funkei]|nr:hypothetical protein [Cellulosimicrobium funkei]
MKPVVRVAALAAGVAAVVGIRFWRENERGKQVWSSATDALDGGRGSSRLDHPDAHN